MGMQICTKCGVEKPFSEFRERKDTKSGYRKDCITCGKFIKKQYYNENKEVLSEKMKAYYLENKEEINERSREYRKQYIKTVKGREVSRLQGAKYRASKKTTDDGTVTYSSTQQRLIEQGFKCRHCSIDLREEGIIKHLDHIHPLSTGGIHSIDNVQWLCLNCNLKKGNKFIG